MPLLDNVQKEAAFFFRITSLIYRLYIRNYFDLGLTIPNNLELCCDYIYPGYPAVVG